MHHAAILLFLLAVPAALSGCVGSDTADDLDGAPTDTVAPRPSITSPAIVQDMDPALPRLEFDPAISVSTDVNMHEPSIAVADDGTIWVTGYVDEPGLLWRSTDGGATFEEVHTTDIPYCNVDDDLPLAAAPASAAVGREGPQPEASHAGCGDVDIAVVGNDTVYWTHHFSGESVHASHDGGETWTPAIWASNEVAQTDRQWLAADAADPMRAWLVFNSGRRGVTGEVGIGPMVVSRTTDGGQTWAQVGQLPESHCIPGPIAHAETDDTLYVGGCSDDGPAVAVSTDGGVRWNWILIAERSGEPVYGICYACGIFTSIDVDDAGTVYAVWADPSINETLDIWMAHSTDQGVTWSGPGRVNHVEGTHVLPFVAAGDDGHVAVAWYGTRSKGDPNGIAATWYVHTAVTTDARAEDPSFTETVAWETPVKEDGPVCISGTGCSSEDRNLGDLLEVAFGPDGSVHVAFTDGRAGGAWNDESVVMYASGRLTPGA